MIVMIPAYEPSERLPELVASLMSADAELGVLVIDDGSGEAYDAVFLRTMMNGAELLRHERNLGKGETLKSGLRHVVEHHPGEGAVTADADGQHTPRDILELVSRLRAAGEGTSATMLLGCRGFDGEVPLKSRIGNDIARSLFAAAAGWRLSDTQTGLRGFSFALIPWMIGVQGSRFEYEQRVLLGLRKAGFQAQEVPIETVYLEHNESSHFRPLIDSVRVMLPVLPFAASSLLGFVVDTLALFTLTALTGALVPSIIGARILSATVNFAVNRRFVFMRRETRGIARDAVKYALLAAALLASNVVWMSYLVGVGVPLIVAKLITELVLFFTGYRAQRNVVFSESQVKQTTTVGAAISMNGGLQGIAQSSLMKRE